MNTDKLDVILDLICHNEDGVNYHDLISDEDICNELVSKGFIEAIGVHTKMGFVIQKYKSTASGKEFNRNGGFKSEIKRTSNANKDRKLNNFHLIITDCISIAAIIISIISLYKSLSH